MDMVDSLSHLSSSMRCVMEVALRSSLNDSALRSNCYTAAGTFKQVKVNSWQGTMPAAVCTFVLCFLSGRLLYVSGMPMSMSVYGERVRMWAPRRYCANNSSDIFLCALASGAVREAWAA